MNKKLAEMSLLKLENFKKEVEFKKSLVSSLNERFLSGYNFIYLKDFVRIDLGLNEELIYEMGEFEETLKDPFFKKILFETKELDEDSRDIFYSIIFAIVLLSEEMFNRNLDEDESPKDPELIKEKISNKILELYKNDELESSLSIFNTEIEETVNYIVENILEYSGEEPSDYDYSGEDPFPVNFVAGMFDIFLHYQLKMITNIHQKGIVLLRPEFYGIRNFQVHIQKKLNLTLRTENIFLLIFFDLIQKQVVYHQNQR